MSESKKIDDGGPALKQCRRCKAKYDPAPWQLAKGDYECKPCKRRRQNIANASDPNFKAKRRARNMLPNVRAYHAEYAVRRMATDPAFRMIRAARRKVATEIEAGRLVRGCCEVCGAPKAEAHHEDYTKPLAVKWLCKPHHAQADAALANRNSGGDK